MLGPMRRVSTVEKPARGITEAHQISGSGLAAKLRAAIKPSAIYQVSAELHTDQGSEVFSLI